MDKTQAREFGEAIAALAATFDRPADEARLLGYKMGLEDLPLSAVKTAVARAMRECDRMPNVAELRALSGEMSPQTRAVIAWGILDKAVGCHCPHHSVDFTCDRIINVLVRNAGGWEHLGEMTPDDWKFFRRDFEKRYTMLYRSGVRAEASMPLVGSFERTNAHSGAKIPKGFEKRCGMVPIAIESTELPALPSGIVRGRIAGPNGLGKPRLLELKKA